MAGRFEHQFAGLICFQNSEANPAYGGARRPPAASSPFAMVPLILPLVRAPHAALRSLRVTSVGQRPGKAPGATIHRCFPTEIVQEQLVSAGTGTPHHRHNRVARRAPYPRVHPLRTAARDGSWSCAHSLRQQQRRRPRQQQVHVPDPHPPPPPPPPQA